MTAKDKPGRYMAEITGHSFRGSKITTHFEIRFRILWWLKGEHLGHECPAHERTIRYHVWDEADNLKAGLGALGIQQRDFDPQDSSARSAINLVGRQFEVDVDDKGRIRVGGGRPMVWCWTLPGWIYD
jgi:hypothetical protein